MPVPIPHRYTTISTFNNWSLFLGRYRGHCTALQWPPLFNTVPSLLEQNSQCKFQFISFLTYWCLPRDLVSHAFSLLLCVKSCQLPAHKRICDTIHPLCQLPITLLSNIDVTHSRAGCLIRYTACSCQGLPAHFTISLSITRAIQLFLYVLVFFQPVWITHQSLYQSPL